MSYHGTANDQVWFYGVLWDIEIHYDYDPEEPETGTGEFLEITDVWVTGFYPEGYGKLGQYVPVNAKSRLNELSEEEYAECEKSVRFAMKKAQRDDFDDHHGYED